MISQYVESNISKKCLISDLVGGVPPAQDGLGNPFMEGTWMYVFTAEGASGLLDSVFKVVFGSWKKMM